jgi:hypothetical protein
MRVENEEVYSRSPKEPIMVRVGGAEMNGEKVVRVTITVLPRKGQTTHDIDLATASFIHAQEMFAVLEAIVSEIEDIGGPGDAINHDLFECAQLMVNDIKEYW